MFAQYDLLQLILLFMCILWCIALIISLATHQGGAYMTWTGHTLQSSFRHGWQCFLGLAIGYIAIYTTNEFLLLMIQGATVFFLISMLVAAVFQRHAQYWSWLCHTGGNLLRRGWLLIVGIGLGYFFHTNTLVTLQLGGY